MGCCISKCKPKKQLPPEEFNHFVHDKLVISDAGPKASKIPTSTSNKISPISPPSPTTSTSSSVSSFTYTNSSNTISSYSTLSGGSSCISSSKDRSFSNEFLWSCIKENPHVIRINSIKECSQLLQASPNHVHAKRLDSPAKIVAAPPKYSIQQGANGCMRQKRLRSNSPTTLNRQKSFRGDSERLDAPSYSLPSRTLRSPSPSSRFNGDSGRVISSLTPTSYSLPSRALRSPSPSRRFNGDSGRVISSLTPTSYSLPSRALTSPSPSRRFNGDSGRVLSSLTPKECGNYSKRMVNNVTSNSATTCVSSSLTKENWKPVTSPYIHQTHLLRPKCMMRNRETCIHRISSKIDEIAVEEALARQESESVPIEDVENPHISLDCFIFL